MTQIVKKRKKLCPVKKAHKAPLIFASSNYDAFTGAGAAG
jgi:hypothetical protein